MASVPKAMLSSTSLDLPKYRAAARDACLAAGTFPVMMEHLPASDADAVQASLRMVDETDIYVGILAHRYGYVPEGSDRSITQMEYERAVERGIPRLMFLIHKDTPVLVDDIETGRAAKRLKAFKDRVSRDRVAHFFRSEDDLRAGLIQALAKLPAVRAGTPTMEAGAAGSDLKVSSLRAPRRLSPLAGHPVLSPSGYPSPVHTGGVHVSFTLAHNGVGQQSINLHALVLEVVRYVPGAMAELAYQIEGEAVQGAGMARPHVFQVTLAGQRVEPARWVVDAARGTVLHALSENFFHTSEPRVLTFPAGSSDIEEVQGTVLAAQPGLYELRFAFYYSVAGADREHRSEVILIYSDE
jgi:hypothetical protein